MNKKSQLVRLKVRGLTKCTVELLSFALWRSKMEFALWPLRGGSVPATGGPPRRSGFSPTFHVCKGSYVAITTWGRWVNYCVVLVCRASGDRLNAVTG